MLFSNKTKFILFQIRKIRISFFSIKRRKEKRFYFKTQLQNLEKFSFLNLYLEILLKLHKSGEFHIGKCYGFINKKGAVFLFFLIFI